MLPRMNPNEVRSYRYFIEVVGPSLAGFFDADFWLDEIPRVCLADPAIWHAIVSLGAAHEANGGPVCIDGDAASTFSLQQFNSAIRCLTETGSPRHSDKGRALTISTIFASMATLQGQYQQAKVHIRAGVDLLRDIEGDERRPVVDRGPHQLRRSPSKFETLPVSVAPIRNLLLRMDMMTRALEHGGMVGSSPPAEILENNFFKAWRCYTCPRPSSTASSSGLTPENILAANRAAESLVYSIVYASQEQGDAIGDVLTGDGGDSTKTAMEYLGSIQRPLIRAYKELRKARQRFEHEVEENPNCGSPKASREQLRDAIIPLGLYLATCRLVLAVDPEEPDIRGRARAFPQLCRSIVDEAEKILSMGSTCLEVDGRKMPFTANSTALDPLSMVAHTANSISIRRVAADLLRKPRLEGIWHTAMTACLADNVMEREMEVLHEYRLQQQLKEQGGGGGGGGGIWDEFPPLLVGGLHEKRGTDILAEEDRIPTVFRVRKMRISFTGTRAGVLSLQTWGDWVKGMPGQERPIRW